MELLGGWCLGSSYLSVYSGVHILLVCCYVFLGVRVSWVVGVLVLRAVLECSFDVFLCVRIFLGYCFVFLLRGSSGWCLGSSCRSGV